MITTCLIGDEGDSTLCSSGTDGSGGPPEAATEEPAVLRPRTSAEATSPPRPTRVLRIRHCPPKRTPGTDGRALRPRPRRIALQPGPTGRIGQPYSTWPGSMEKIPVPSGQPAATKCLLPTTCNNGY